jgi:hypothetical protein
MNRSSTSDVIERERERISEVEVGNRVKLTERDLVKRGANVSANEEEALRRAENMDPPTLSSTY